MRPAPNTAADFLDSGQYETARSAERVADLRERIKRASFSRDKSYPLEKSAREAPTEACGTVHLYRLEDGRLLARRVDCRTKACPKCGPRLRAEYATGYAQVLAGQVVYRLVVADRDWRRWQARIKRRGGKVLRIPAEGDQLVLYTTAELSAVVADVAQVLAEDFAAMPADRRNVSASTAWRHAYHAWRDQQQRDAKHPAEHLGLLRRSLGQVAIIADDLGMLLGDPGLDALYLRDPPDRETWQRFCSLAGLYHPHQAEAAA